MGRAVTVRDSERGIALRAGVGILPAVEGGETELRLGEFGPPDAVAALRAGLHGVCSGNEAI